MKQQRPARARVGAWRGLLFRGEAGAAYSPPVMILVDGAQVWALDVGGEAEALLVTGGADARVNVWRDCTSADAAVAAAGAAVAARKAQQLANALQARAQANALQGL